MPKSTTLEERMRIIELAQQGLSNRLIAQQLHLSPYTVRKWRRRYREHGRAGLVSSMGRPPRGALSTFPTEVRGALRALRLAHPGWGALSLLAVLRRDPRWRGERLPGRSQVARFLHEQGLIKRHQKRSQPPQVPPPEKPVQPHQEWEMDAQGVIRLPGLGRATVINISDRALSLHIGALICPRKSKPNGDDYRRALRMAFAEFGLPQQISLDHDTAFLGVHARSPFPTAFLLWLIALGVQVRFIQAPPPKEHARVEGRHAVSFAQALEGRSFSSWPMAQQALDSQRKMTNQVYPVPELGHRPRLEAFPQARHSGRGYHPQHEAAMLDVGRVKTYLSQGHWYRQVNRQGQCSLGRRVYTLGKAWAGRQVHITYDVAQDALRFTWKKETLYRPMAGLDTATLMGQDAPWLLPSGVQLPLPFTPQQACALQAYVGTTFPDSVGV